jgi:simple sugar transport system permease protein
MSDLGGAVLSVAFISQVLRISVPYVLGALGAAVTERSGVVDLAVESKLLFGAFAAAVGARYSGSVLVGMVAGATTGAVVALAQGWAALVMLADQVVVGIALNLVALAGTRFLLQVAYGESSNSPPCPTVRGPLVDNPMFWAAAAASVLIPLVLARTRWGLRLRAAGDRPLVLQASGIAPKRVRLSALAVGGALAGIGGAQLSISIGGFVAAMSGGRGYIALAAVVFSNWRPGWAALASLGVGLAEAATIQLQLTGGGVPRELSQLLPAIVTVAILAIWGGGRHPPAALGAP